MPKKKSSYQKIPNKRNPQRRKLLKTLAAGGGVVTVSKNLPESWTQPVIDTVLLPAHAQTSACILNARITVETDDPSTTTTQFNAGTFNGVGLADDAPDYLFEVFVSPPQAIPVTLTVTGIDADRADDDSFTADGDAIRQVAGLSSAGGNFGFDATDTDDTPDDLDNTLELVATSPGCASSTVTINWA